MPSNKYALITDLDNKLFDWVDLWVNCFSAMLESIVEISGIPKEQLVPEIAAVHQNMERRNIPF
jgi:phosphoglycolate phosphatase